MCGLRKVSDKEYRKKVITRKAEQVLNLLSTRETQCLSWMAEGMSMKEVALKLNISDETVNTHAKAIRRKLNCKNITQAVALANKYGLILNENTRIRG